MGQIVAKTPANECDLKAFRNFNTLMVTLTKNRRRLYRDRRQQIDK